MDLSKFRESTRPVGNKASFIHREWTRIKYWVLPPTNEKRTERFGQYRDFSIFLGAIVLVALTEDKISKWLDVTPEDMSKVI
jgi:hypothetical protein